MYYEINISQRDVNGRYVHMFATHPRSLITRDAFEYVLRQFVLKFPAPEYNISAYHRVVGGTYIDFDPKTGVLK